MINKGEIIGRLKEENTIMKVILKEFDNRNTIEHEFKVISDIKCNNYVNDLISINDLVYIKGSLKNINNEVIIEPSKITFLKSTSK